MTVNNDYVAQTEYLFSLGQHWNPTETLRYSLFYLLHHWPALVIPRALAPNCTIYYNKPCLDKQRN